MAGTTSQPRQAQLDREKLLERILIARPGASLEDIRCIAALFWEVADKQLQNQVARIRQRIAAKAKKSIQRRR